MTDREKFLLIGGQSDGRWVYADQGQPSITVYCREPLPQDYQWDAVVNPSEGLKMVNEVYLRHPIHSSRGLETAVYVMEGLDPLAELIKGYRKLD